MKREFREAIGVFPVILSRFPCYYGTVPCYFLRGKSAKIRMNAALLDDAAVILATIIRSSLYFSLLWEIRVTRLVRLRLRPPPRSPAQTEISQFNANRPELAAICARILSLQSADWIAGTVSGPLSLPWKIAFPDGGSWPW